MYVYVNLRRPLDQPDNRLSEIGIFDAQKSTHEASALLCGSASFWNSAWLH